LNSPRKKDGPDCKPGQPIYLNPGTYTVKATIAGVPSQGENSITIVEGQVSSFIWY